MSAAEIRCACPQFDARRCYVARHYGGSEDRAQEAEHGERETCVCGCHEDEHDEIDDESGDDDWCGEPVTCQACGGEGEIVVCPDDMCHGAGECMHGDGMATCPECGGEGER